MQTISTSFSETFQRLSLGFVTVSYHEILKSGQTQARLDYQPLFREMSLRSSPKSRLRGGTQTGPERAAEIEPRHKHDAYIAHLHRQSYPVFLGSFRLLAAIFLFGAPWDNVIVWTKMHFFFSKVDLDLYRVLKTCIFGFFS